MNWIQENKFLTAWLIITVLAVLGLGFLLLKARGEYNDAYAQYDNQRKAVFQLESKPLYPNEKNEGQMRAAVDAYEESVEMLHGELSQFQRDLRPIEQVAFQSKLKDKIQKINNLAAKKNVTLPDGFSLGLESYAATLPPSRLCPLLDYQLDALDLLANMLIEHGVTEIMEFKRHKIAGEVGGPRPPKDGEDAPVPVIERYPVEIKVKIPQEAVQLFVNDISNPTPGSFFYVIRLLRIANEEQVGPPKTPAPVAPTPALVIEEDVEDPDGEGDIEGFSGDDFEIGIAPVMDANFVLGQEELEAFFGIDLLRFQPPTPKDDEEEGQQK